MLPVRRKGKNMPKHLRTIHGKSKQEALSVSSKGEGDQVKVQCPILDC